MDVFPSQVPKTLPSIAFPITDLYHTIVALTHDSVSLANYTPKLQTPFLFRFHSRNIAYVWASVFAEAKPQISKLLPKTIRN